LTVVVDKCGVHGKAVAHSTVTHVALLINVEGLTNEVTVLGNARIVLKLIGIYFPSQNWMLLQFLQSHILKFAKDILESTKFFVLLREHPIDNGLQESYQTMGEEFNGFEVEPLPFNVG